MPETTLERLKRMTAWTAEPTLSSDELEALLDQFRVVDKNGVQPGGTGYIATYRLRAAAAEGWRRKMGRASEMVSTDLDGDRISANRIFDHCERMVKAYGTATSVVVSGQ